MVKNSNGEKNKKRQLFKKPEMMEPEDLEKLMGDIIVDNEISNNSDAGFEDVVESFNEIKQDLKAEETLTLKGPDQNQQKKNKKKKNKNKGNHANPQTNEKTDGSERKNASGEKTAVQEKVTEPEKKEEVPEQKPEEPVQTEEKPEEKPVEAAKAEEKPEEKPEEPVKAEEKPEEKPEEPVKAEEKPEEKPEEPVKAEEKPEEKPEEAAKAEEKSESAEKEEAFQIQVPEEKMDSTVGEPEETFDAGGLEEKIEAATAELLGTSRKQEEKQPAGEKETGSADKKEETDPSGEKLPRRKRKAKKQAEVQTEEISNEYPDDVPKHRGLWKKIVGFILALCVIASAAFAYLLVADYFTDHFYRNTIINGKDCTYLTADQVKEQLQKDVEKYHMDIETVDGDIYTVEASQVNMRYVDDKQVDMILQEQDPMKWIVHVFSSSNQEVALESEYDKEKVAEVIQTMPFMLEENITKPADAYMQQSEGEYVVVPEVEGNQPDPEKVVALAEKTIENKGEKMSLVDGDCYMHPTVRKEDANLNGQVQSLNVLTSSVLTYQVSGETYTLDRNTLKDWVIQDEQGNYSLDPNKMAEYINVMADKRDTYGGTRQFVTSAGNEITLAQNYYGWKVNREKSVQELKAALEEGRQGEMELVYSHKAQGEGANDLGSVYVEISIDQQRMWCYKDGQVVVDTPIVSGNLSIPGRATPRNGCWQIFRKNTEYTMRGPRMANGQPEYTAFVHYWMPFNGGVGIHDLASRGNNFGGDIYKTRGSHGCINTPLGAVAAIYNTVSVGTPVIVY